MMTIKELYNIFNTSTGVCTDTRNIKVGSIFFALKGASFDGNLFANKALDQGAGWAVVDDPKLEDNDRFILVKDVLRCLQSLATYHRRELGIPIVGITGTNGKTTTKELVKVVLDKKLHAFATEGNFNNHIGVPLTLLSLNKKMDVAVVEMGANHLEEIDLLCNIAEPSVGLITNVGRAHLEGFGSFDGVKKTKGELYRFIEEKRGLLFVNKSNPHLLGMLGEGAKLFFYGDDDDCRVKVTELKNTANLSFSCVVDKEKIEIKANLIGGYNMENALAAISVGLYFGVLPTDIEDAINSYVPENNRSQMVVSENNKILFDAYNANPTSMKAALENFVALKEDNKIVILGEMKELGNDSESEHIKTLNFLRNQDLSSIYLVGESYKVLLSEHDGINWFEDVISLRNYILDNEIKNSFILVKGSRSNQLEKLKEVL